ncbi:hypothetical protein NDU88_000295 [Pleurodeles waltl]|uniref:Uncharacterized protein n=1 Tax=Pleurodeles waltl TaxID=8319 RepID=A0AAV7L630_PLEWA|nr:hypothetical protein NDU88_000295 [Pleurodeles waltl]
MRWGGVALGVREPPVYRLEGVGRGQCATLKRLSHRRKSLGRLRRLRSGAQSRAHGSRPWLRVPDTGAPPPRAASTSPPCPVQGVQTVLGTVPSIITRPPTVASGHVRTARQIPVSNLLVRAEHLIEAQWKVSMPRLVCKVINAQPRAARIGQKSSPRDGHMSQSRLEKFYSPWPNPISEEPSG